MNEFSINVSEVEDLQMTNNTHDLERIFNKAHSTIVQGETVVLIRQNADRTTYKFDEMTTEAELQTYKEKVFKYL